MKDWTRAGILGFIQGLTDFQPVSSSGHLVVFQNLLGMRELELLLDTVLHLGTLTAALVIRRLRLRETFEGLRMSVKGPGRTGVVRDHVGWKWRQWTIAAGDSMLILGRTWPAVVLGLAVSAVAGCAALRLPFNLLEKQRFHLFGSNCMAVGSIAPLTGLRTGV